MPDISPLEPRRLYSACDTALLNFETTAELGEAEETLGQRRAIEALHFGIDIRRPGYNVFVLGNPGSGRHSTVRRLLEEKAADETVPGDWCYVNNFSNPNQPRLLRLPTGRGAKLKQQMQQFVSELPNAIESGFDTDEYRTRIEAIREALKEREKSALVELGQTAEGDGVALVRTPSGFVFAPLKGEHPMDPERFNKLPDAERERLGAIMNDYGERLAKLMRQFPRWRRETQDSVKAATHDMLNLAVGHLLDELRDDYQDLPEVLAFFDQVMADVLEVGEALHEQPKGDGETELVVGGTLSAGRYLVNLLVDNGTTLGAPVVFEDNPIYPNLVGRVDQLAHMGMLVTDFTFIKPGALHRANGGYLVLDAARVLTQPYAWEGLKRSLRTAQIRIESLGQVFGLSATLPMEPEPVPLSVKVVLVGERQVYYMLKQLDPDFADLFKIAADFEDEVVRDDDGTRQYARFIATAAREAGLLPFARTAVARVIEHGARLAEDAGKLSTDRRRIVDLLNEADHYARRAGREAVAREDVDRALSGQIGRADRLRGTVHEQILHNTLMISVDGAEIGQVNALAVIDLGDFRFAHPVRITATARLGEGEVIDIERESELGGAIHSKGVMILSAFLSARYAPDRPLSIAASLVFEQSYGPVEGDSASLAELCALMSTLAMVPIKQSLALTGSVNQLGRVQAIGGVNEKIEGFFDICRARGLNGEQGVLIPAANVKHLMLREDVVAACSAGRFRIYAVEDVDQAIELLTGVSAGQPDDEGLVPEGSINWRVADRLVEMSMLRKDFASSRARGDEEAQTSADEDNESDESGDEPT